MSGGGGGGGGGVLPGQAALAQYQWGENEVASRATQAQSGTPNSTMGTLSSAGDYMNQALQLSEMSQADTAAQNAASSQAKGQITSGIGGIGSLLGGGFI